MIVMSIPNRGVAQPTRRGNFMPTASTTPTVVATGFGISRQADEARSDIVEENR